MASTAVLSRVLSKGFHSLINFFVMKSNTIGNKKIDRMEGMKYNAICQHNTKSTIGTTISSVKFLKLTQIDNLKPCM